MPRTGEGYAGGRIAWFDNLKFILIFFVVFGHAIDPFRSVFPVYSRLFFFIFMFHMPLFMFVTGLFSRKALGYDSAAAGAPARTPGLRRAAGFLVLYLMLNFFIFAVERFAAGKDVIFNPLVVRNASWYFLACCILTFACALSDGAGRTLTPRRKALVVLIAALSAIVIGYFGAFGDLLALSRVICFAPFFLAGLYIGPERIARMVKGISPGAGTGRAMKRRDVLIAVFALAGVLVTALLMPGSWVKVGVMLSARNPYADLGGLAAYGPLIRFVWYAAASALGVCVMILTPVRATFFTRLGSNTIAVYVWHLLLLRLVGASASVPALAFFVAGADAAAQPALSLIPVGLSFASVFLFSLKPPFGLAAGGILRAMNGRATARRQSA
jgi:fucose 4-O-acetylase-like acetyltransferase